ncbi:MAG: hypothetical protein AB3N15_06705 [Paracoccaceae bacterium]
MKKFLTVVLCAGSLATMAPIPADAGAISKACRASDRPAANTRLCNCIQRVANQSLSASERRKVAKWFSDPHEAQEIRMSDKRSDERLWRRYKAFGARAQNNCG